MKTVEKKDEETTGKKQLAISNQRKADWQKAIGKTSAFASASAFAFAYTFALFLTVILTLSVKIKAVMNDIEV